MELEPAGQGCNRAVAAESFA